MKRTFYIVSLVVATMLAACSGGGTFLGGSANKRVVAAVDDKELTLGDILDNMPQGFVGADSVTFVRMYTDNWVLNQLKLSRADEVLASHEDIDRLVEGYRQSLIMRQLDQYYVDKELDTEITERQIMAHYRTNSSQFVLDHDKVRGVVVRVDKEFRNSSALSDAMRNISDDGMQELMAFAEKHSLQVNDLTAEWVTFSDFLSYLPTVRTRSYNNLLQKGKVQSMRADDVVFYFVVVDVVREGDLIPLECVEDDIRRMIYAERSAEIVKRYERELKYEAVESGRVDIDDASLMDAMSNRPKINDGDVTVGEAKDVVEERDVESKKSKRNEEAESDKASESEEKSTSERKSTSDEKSSSKSSKSSTDEQGEDNKSKSASDTAADAKSNDDVKPAASEATQTLEPKTESQSEPEVKSEAAAEPKTEAAAEAKVETKTEVKTEAKTEVKTEAKAEIKVEESPAQQEE